MENTELIKVLRCELYGDDECDKSDCPIWSELGCRNGIGNRAAADSLEALLKERTEMIEGAKKTAKVYAKFYEKYIELEEQMLKIKSRIYDLESMAKREYDDDDDNEYLEGYFDGLHQAAKLISTTLTIEKRVAQNDKRRTD